MCDKCGCDGDETPCDSCSMKEASNRNRFERWLKANTTCCTDRDGVSYQVYETDLAWRAWQAANNQADRLCDLLRRYRTETPAGNQPHMICHEVDKLLGEAN